MPELPEVETVRRTLAEGGLIGRRITKVVVRHPGAVRYPDAAAFAGRLQGRTIRGIGRRGKYLLFEIDESTLVCHLRMTGRLWLSAADAEELSHTHVVLRLDDGRELRFRDVRRFGGFHLPEADGQGLPQGLEALGPEPEELSAAAIEAACARHARRPVKALLLDQDFVAGLGNIYADEALFRARVHPARTCGSLSAKERSGILRAITAVLGAALKNRGTTFLDFRDGAGEPGAFQNFLRVYRREGLPCRRCGTQVAKARIAGRGTHFCPNCQRRD